MNTTKTNHTETPKTKKVYAEITLGINPLEKVVTAIVALDIVPDGQLLDDIKLAAENKLCKKYGVSITETIRFPDWKYFGDKLELLLD